MCTKNPSLPKAYCSHCQGTARTSAPVFSLREEHFLGYPTVEVLKNGGPVHSWDSNFRFGQRKAAIMLACIAALREFGNARDDDERRIFEARVIENRGLRVQIEVQMRPEFETSTGLTVERPYLYLQALPPATGHIGVGVLKCRAICAVERHLQDWLSKTQGTQGFAIR